MDIQELLRAARHLNGWSQRDLAERLGVSKSRVAGWEAGTRALPAASLAALLDLSGLDLALVPAQVVPDGLVQHLSMSTSQRLLVTLAGRWVHLSGARNVPVWRALGDLARRGQVAIHGPAALGLWLPGVWAPAPLPVESEATTPFPELLAVAPPERAGAGPVRGVVPVGVSRVADVLVPSPYALALDPRCAAHAGALQTAARLLHEQAGRDRGGRRAPGHRSPQEVREARHLSTSPTYAYTAEPTPNPLDSRGWRLRGRVSLDQYLVDRGLPPRTESGGSRTRSRLAG